MQALKASVSVQINSVQSSSAQAQSESKIKPSSSSSNQFSSSRTTQCTVAIARSSITIDQTMREKIYSLLTKEILYSDIIEEMESTGINEIIRGQEKYQMKKKMLMIHVAGQPEDV